MELNQNQKLALVLLVGLAIAGFGLWAKIGGSAGGDEIDVIQPAGVVQENVDPLRSQDIAAGDGDPKTLVVHVAGEVKLPDVYTLPAGSRVTDAIKKAGGATLYAQLDSLNLAALLKDGEKIQVPSKVQPINLYVPPSSAQPASNVQINTRQTPQASGGNSTGGKLKNPGEGSVNLNTADLNELQRLPGVGPSTAQKILEYRNQIGRFSLPDQLMDVKGIGPKKYEKMRPFITL